MHEAALYIHIPFCEKKCMYCDFPSYCNKENMMEAYANALGEEISRSAEGTIISSIFIGGGTPTYLSLEAWKIIGEVLNKINKKQGMEFSVECNPGTVNMEKLLYLKKLGVNRLSIGLQAWQDSLLRKIGRIHTRKQFLECYENALKCGFDNINVDVMFGLPDQTVDDIEETLKNVINLKPKHISCYSLIVEEGTPFFELFKQGKLNLPEEDEERVMNSKAHKLLEEAGFNKYEISNYSLPGYECKHNLVYWDLKDYIGCGAAAHSYVDNIRYNNESHIEEYIKLINDNSSAVVNKIVNSLQNNMEEFMFMGLRKINGIDEKDFSERFNTDIDSVFGDVIQKHMKNGLLLRSKGRLFLSKAGLDYSNIVMSDFLL